MGGADEAILTFTLSLTDFSTDFFCKYVAARVCTELAGWFNVIFGSYKLLMGKNLLAVFVTIAFSLLGVVGDYFLKLASANENSLKTTSFYIGFVLYASTAFGWVFVMKHLKLATIGVVYSVSMVLLLTAMGVVFFRESLNTYEIVGLIMAIASLILLVRFA